MALFASPFDIFAIPDGHMHLHPRHAPPSSVPQPRRRRQHPDHHGSPFARHLDPFFHFLMPDGTFDDRMDTEEKEKDVFHFEPEVIENDFGYLLSARVPGVSAKDITVNVKPGKGFDVLTVRCASHPHVKADLRLPGGKHSAYNVADVAASCIDGVLRVAVPKMTPTSTAIVVAEPPARDEEMGEEQKDDDAADAQARAQTIVLQVPGFSRDDITVTRKRPAEQLVVTGKSRRRGGGEFKREYRLSDPDSTVTATCADGLLTIRVVNPIVAPFQVPVSADRMLPPTSSSSADDAAPAAENANAAAPAAAEEKKITVMRQAVPGAAAADFKVEVTPGEEGTLKAHADYAVAGLGRRRFHFAVSLPAGVDRSTLRANVVDGLLTVTAAAPVPPAPVAVEVSGDKPAALPTATPSTTLADAATADRMDADKER